MKIRNNSRILALVLALVMILPLISIPVFADETDAPATPEFSENFEGEGASVADVANTSLSAVTIKDAADTAHGKVMEVSATPRGSADYYLMSSNQKSAWAINGTVTEGKISGIANNITIENADVPTSDNSAVAVNIGGTDYYIATDAYADAKAGFINGAFGNPLTFKNPEFLNAAGHVTIQTDFFVSEDFLSGGGFTGRIGGTKVDGGANVSVELFKITRAANGDAMLAPHGNATAKKGESVVLPRNTWVSLVFDINLANAEIDVLVNGQFAFREVNNGSNAYALINAPINLKPNSFSMENSRGHTPDKCGGFVQFDNIVIRSGASGFTYNPDAIKPVIIDFEKYNAGVAPSGDFASIAVADSVVDDTLGTKSWKISFERPNGENKYNIDKNPMIKSPALSYESLDKIVYETSYFFPIDATGQIQTQFTNSTAKINGTTGSVSWVDLYQIAFSNGQATLKFESGVDSTVAELKDKIGDHVGNGKTYKFATGMWNTISCVIDLDTGMYDVYVNGELAIASVQNYRGGVLTDITIAANKIIVGGKVNKVNGAGTFYVDNIKVFEGDAPSVKPAPAKDVEDFENYKYSLGYAIAALSAPKLATYKLVDDNIVIDLPIAGTKAEGALALLREDGRKIGSTQVTVDEEDETIIYAVLEDGEEWELVLEYDEWEEAYYVTWEDEDGNLIPLTDATLDPEAENYYDRYFLVDANVADLAYGVGGQFGLATKIAHKKYSYATTEKVVLSADYFIAPDSKGIIEAQFESYYYDTVEGEGEEAVTTTNTGSWIQLYYFDLANGQFEGLDEYMTVGAWNNVKVIMNLVTGEYDIYLNDAFVKSEEVGHGNLTIGSNAASTFSCAKIQRTTSLHGEACGNLMIDNVGVHTNVPTGSQYGDGYLSDEAYFNNLGNALITVPDPSFRFEDINGIRFATMIDEEFFAGILANLGEDAVVGMGTIIAPADYVALAGAFTKEALEAIEVETAKYLDIPFAEYFDGAKGVDFGDAKVFTASIVGIKEANLMRDFAAVGYITIKIDENTTRTYYAKSYATSNVVYEAKETIAVAAPFDYTEEELAVLNAFAEADVEELIWIDAPYGSFNSPEFAETPMYVEVLDRIFYSFWGEFATLTISGPEGFKLYFDGEFIDSVDGKVVLENVAGDFEIGGIVIGLFDAGAYSFEGVAPLGSAENPIVIESLEDVVNVAVPENGLVYYQLVAGSTGYIVVTTESELASLYVYTENVQMNPLEGAGTVKIPVMTGETVMIQVSTIRDEETFTAPAGDVAFALATEAAATVTGPEMSVELAAGEWYMLTGRAMQLAGMYLNIADTNLYYVVVNGEWYFDDEGVGHSILLAGDDFGQVTILFKNNTEEAFTVDLAFSANPLSADGEKIIAGEFGNGTPIALGEGTAVSYGEGHLSWTAEAAGTFTFEITSTENWAMNITNQNSKQSDTLTAMGDIAVITFEVAAGDVLDIMVGALDFNSVEFTFVASFAAAE